MVEVAVGLPFLILLVVALVEMGILFASYLALVNATREGALFASAHPELIDTTNCNPPSTPNAYPMPEDTPGYCIGASDDATFGGCTGLGCPTVWQEYYGRVADEVLFPLGEQLRRGGLLDQDALTVDRPVLVDSSCVAFCQFTVTTHYRLHTLTSDISLPGFGRMGLPNYYQMDYSLLLRYNQDSR